MKATIKIPLIILLLMLVVNVSFGQQTLEIKPYTGLNVPVGTFSNFSKKGVDFGLSADYFFNPNFGFGLDINNQMNGFKNPMDFSRIPEPDSLFGAYNIVDSGGGSWNKITFSFGPTYRMNYKKFSSDLYVKAGVSILSTPTASSVFNHNGFQQDLFRLSKQNQVSFGLTSGIRFYYHISKKLSVYVNPQFVYSSAKVSYTEMDIDQAFIFDAGSNEEVFNPGILLQRTPVEKEFKPSYLNFNAGLSVNIGTKDKPAAMKDSFGPTYRIGHGQRSVINKESNSSEGEDKIAECYPAKLNKEGNQKDFVLDQKARPSFNWAENGENKASPEKYILRIFNEKNELVYTQETEKTSVPHTKELEAIYQEYASEEKKRMYWDVESQFVECGSQTSESNSFNLKSTSAGLDLTFLKIECESPAFDEDGFVYYTAEVLLENSANNNTNITIPQQTFSLEDANTGASTDGSNQIVCDNSSIVQMPVVLAPGDSKVLCIAFKRPFGESVSKLTVDYFIGNYSNSVIPEIAFGDLPNCICNVCEDWKYTFTTNGVVALSPNSNQLRILSDLQIDNTDFIQEVSAQIVSVRHKISDEACNTCTKKEDEMALFTYGKISPRDLWKDNGEGQSYAQNSDNVGNILSWKANSPGVDYSTPKRFHLDFTVPERSNLDCCNSLFTVCVRYTFTNINCETCTYLKCHEINLEKLIELDPNKPGKPGEDELK